MRCRAPVWEDKPCKQCGFDLSKEPPSYDVSFHERTYALWMDDALNRRKAGFPPSFRLRIWVCDLFLCDLVVSFARKAGCRRVRARKTDGGYCVTGELPDLPN